MYLNTYMVLKVCKDCLQMFKVYEEYYYNTDLNKSFVMNYEVFKDFNRIVNNQIIIFYYSINLGASIVTDVVKQRLIGVSFHKFFGKRCNGIIKLYISKLIRLESIKNYLIAHKIGN